MNYEYRVTAPWLPQGATSPVMDSLQMSDWLNKMTDNGWEFVGYGATHWHERITQDWWIFRRPLPDPPKEGG